MNVKKFIYNIKTSRICQCFINDVISALTIQQPFVEAIIKRIKKTENRSRSIFSIHCPLCNEHAQYQQPCKPITVQCKFCPQNKQMCSFWLHRIQAQNGNNINGLSMIIKVCNFTDRF